MKVSEAQPPSNYKEDFDMEDKKFWVVWMVVLIAAILIAVSVNQAKRETTTIRSENMQEVAGNYFLYKTVEAQEYLSFLEQFDETKYEIVNISTSMSTGGYGSGEFYMVTYKVLSEAE